MKARVIINETQAARSIEVPANSVICILPLENHESPKMLLVGCTHGNQQTEATYNDKSVWANVNIGIFKSDKK